MYAATRRFALALARAATFSFQEHPLLVGIAGVTMLVQALDTLVGIQRRDTLMTYGPADTAFVNAIARVWML